MVEITAAGLRTAEGNSSFWITAARKGNGLIHLKNKKKLGVPSEPDDPREHKPKSLQVEV